MDVNILNKANNLKITGFVAGLFCGGLVGVYHLFHG